MRVCVCVCVHISLDVCVVGVPLDIGTSNRSGTRHVFLPPPFLSDALPPPHVFRYGPRQVRSESALLRPFNMSSRAAPFDSLNVGDVGDVAINTFNLQKSMSIISDSFRGAADCTL